MEPTSKAMPLPEETPSQAMCTTKSDMANRGIKCDVLSSGIPLLKGQPTATPTAERESSNKALTSVETPSECSVNQFDQSPVNLAIDFLKAADATKAGSASVESEVGHPVHQAHQQTSERIKVHDHSYSKVIGPARELSTKADEMSSRRATDGPSSFRSLVTYFGKRNGDLLLITTTIAAAASGIIYTTIRSGYRNRFLTLCGVTCSFFAMLNTCELICEFGEEYGKMKKRQNSDN